MKHAESVPKNNKKAKLSVDNAISKENEIEQFLSSLSSSNPAISSLSLLSKDANDALETCLLLIKNDPLQSQRWSLFDRVITRGSTLFDLFISSDSVLLKSVIAALCSHDKTLRLACEAALVSCFTMLDFKFSLDHLTTLLTSISQPIPLVILNAYVTCIRVSPVRKIFDSIVGNPVLLERILVLASNSSSLHDDEAANIAQSIISLVFFESDTMDDIMDVTASTRKNTNQVNWRLKFWTALFALEALPNKTFTVLCRLHFQSHAASSTQFWFKCLFHTLNKTMPYHQQELLSQGPMYYSPTSEDDLKSLHEFTSQLFSTPQLLVNQTVVIQSLFMVDHRVLESYFPTLVDVSLELSLCVLQSCVKTRRIPLWISLMRDQVKPILFLSLKEQNEFRSQCRTLFLHVLMHQQHSVFVAFEEGLFVTSEKVNSEVLLCAMEAFLNVLPCHMDRLSWFLALEQKMDKIDNKNMSECMKISCARLRETLGLYKGMLTNEFPLVVHHSTLDTVLHNMESENVFHLKQVLHQIDSKDEAILVWRHVFHSSSSSFLLSQAWFFELRRIRHFLPDFVKESNLALDRLKGFPVGYLSPKHWHKILTHCQSYTPHEVFAQTLVFHPEISWFASTRELVEFAVSLENENVAFQLLAAGQGQEMDKKSLSMLKHRPRLLFASARHFSWSGTCVSRLLQLVPEKEEDGLYVWAAMLQIMLVSKETLCSSAGVPVGQGLKMATLELHTDRAQTFVDTCTQVFHLLPEDKSDHSMLVSVLFALSLQMSVMHRNDGALHHMLLKAKTQHVAPVLDTLLAYAWSVEVDKQAFAAKALHDVFAFGVRGNFETLITRRMNKLLVALSHLCALEHEHAWLALMTWLGTQTLPALTARDVIVLLTPLVPSTSKHKCALLLVLLECFPHCITGDATSSCVLLLLHVQLTLPSHPYLWEGFSKVCEKLSSLERTFKHHAVSLLTQHVNLCHALPHHHQHIEMYMDRVGFYLLDVCGEFELIQLNNLMSEGEQSVQDQKRHFLRTLVENHKKHHVFKGKT